MKTKIAAVLILIYELFAAIFVGAAIPTTVHYGITEPIPLYPMPLLLTTSVLLLITACLLLSRITKAAWWSCVFLSLTNLGIMCWGIIYYLGIYCDGPCQTPPETGAAEISIIVAVILASSLLLLLLDTRNVNRLSISQNMKTQGKSPLVLIITSIVIFILIVFMIILSSGGVYDTSRSRAYCAVREDIQNAVTAYMADANHSSQMPIISENATFTLTNPNGSYYIINMSPLLVYNGGLLRQVPDGCSQIPGPDNDNCDGGAPRCSNTSHYIWGIDNAGKVVSKPVNTSDYSTSNESQCNACNYCQCDTCDGYQGVWP